MASIEIINEDKVLGQLLSYPVKGSFFVAKRSMEGGFVNAECFLKCNDDRMLEEILIHLNASLQAAKERIEVLGQVMRIIEDTTPEFVRVYLRENPQDESESYMVTPKTPEVIVGTADEFAPINPTNDSIVDRKLGVTTPPQYSSDGYVDL